MIPASVNASATVEAVVDISRVSPSTLITRGKGWAGGEGVWFCRVTGVVQATQISSQLMSNAGRRSENPHRSIGVEGRNFDGCLGRIPEITNLRAEVPGDFPAQIVIDRLLELLENDPGRCFGVLAVGVSAVTGDIFGELVKRQIALADVDQPPAARQIASQIFRERVGQFALRAAAQVKSQCMEDGKGKAGCVTGSSKIALQHHITIKTVDWGGLVTHEIRLPGLTCVDLSIYFNIRSG